MGYKVYTLNSCFWFKRGIDWHEALHDIERVLLECDDLIIEKDEHAIAGKEEIASLLRRGFGFEKASISKDGALTLEGYELSVYADSLSVLAHALAPWAAEGSLGFEDSEDNRWIYEFDGKGGVMEIEGEIVFDPAKRHLPGNSIELAEKVAALRAHAPGDYRCCDCHRRWHEDELVPMDPATVLQRVLPGEVMPYGECPACRAVCHKGLP